jgi:protein MPE1
VIKSSIPKDDEAAAMAAMFQAQTAHWEETQQQMTQLVSRFCGFIFVVVAQCLMNLIFVSFHITSHP